MFLGIPSLGSSGATLAWPVLGSVISGFGQRRFGWHAGIDIKADVGTPIVAAAPGVVSSSGFEGSYGWIVRISHNDGLSTIYAHNLQNLIEVGDSVEAGTVVALVGSTGHAGGPHVHFEVHRDGTAYNPLLLLTPREGTAAADDTASIAPTPEGEQTRQSEGLRSEGLDE